MSEDQKFRIVAGNEKLAENDPNVVLGLALLKKFRLLNLEDKHKVIQLVDQLASSSPPEQD